MYHSGYDTEAEDADEHRTHESKRPTDEELVARHIFDGYDPCARPVINGSHVLKMDFNMDLINLANMDEVKQVLETNVWMEMVGYLTIFSRILKAVSNNFLAMDR